MNQNVDRARDVAAQHSGAMAGPSIDLFAFGGLPINTGYIAEHAPPLQFEHERDAVSRLQVGFSTGQNRCHAKNRGIARILCAIAAKRPVATRNVLRPNAPSYEGL